MSQSAEHVVLLPEGLGMYIDIARERHPGMDEVWLLGKPSDHPHGKEGLWTLLAFGTEAVLESLRADTSLHRCDVQLLVVTDGDRYASAWGEGESGSLTNLKWRRGGADSAAYAGAAEGAGVAMRVR
jgi:hypothetical protein